MDAVEMEEAGTSQPDASDLTKRVGVASIEVETGPTGNFTGYRVYFINGYHLRVDSGRDLDIIGKALALARKEPT